MVIVATGGPQVVNITVTAPSPSVAAGTAQAVIDEYASQTTAALTSTDRVAVQYYDQQLGQAEATLQRAQQQLSAYLAAHPTVPSTGIGNATATELAQAVTLDTTSYQSVLSQYQSAELSLANVGSQTGFQVLDAPSASATPVSSSKKLLETGLAGLVVGLLVSVLLITALTAMDRTSRRAEDIRRTLGLEVAASIGRFPRSAAGTRRGNAL
jgi:capsular polysaccharide biosynthesis protein